MMYFEKAIENYAKARKEFYAQLLKDDIADFNQKIEQMTATGRCYGIACKYCPIRLASDAGIKMAGCDMMSPQLVREVIAMEVAER